ncbi:DUF2523 family protein [Xylophilus ampelinus]|uniref:Uncharacterized protein DUF2523 n=1 Tax=Xylophilus ampelinus TaxID=54067 RepID=A0A318SP29_9BURK|nr:DUF2523 family protein [Xylophilus ampelinus]MCS4511932.1 DUF2523 domain-containing protein [Xylophilus ampelinus]PYE72692.1 uncharacterized protein DUF2523 [Xylophilus ampelinus]
MKLGTWLLAMVQPMLAKILLSLGFSLVTIVGMDVVIGQMRDMVAGNVNALPADILNVFLLAGGGKGLGIIFGAIATRLLLWQITSATKLLGVNNG